MRWPMVEQAYRNELQKLYVFDPKTPEGIARWQDLHNRVIEHVFLDNFCIINYLEYPGCC